jgi:hypothetical protein
MIEPRAVSPEKPPVSEGVKTIMGSKKTGAASATGTTKKTSKTAASEAPKVKTYKDVRTALYDFSMGEQPRGAKFIIGDKATRLVTATRGGEKVHLTFEGTPAEFAQAVLKQRGIRSENASRVVTGSNPPASDDGE